MRARARRRAAFAPPPGPAFDATRSALEAFESLTLAPAGPGAPGGDPAYFPRPTGDAAAGAGDAPPPPYPGNCDARFMRMTVNAIPAQQAVRARFQLPIGAIVHPLADPQDVPVVPLGPAGIVRCKRCRTYVNPFVTWTDGGRRFQCNVCAMLNDVPVEYYCSLDADGRRLDAEDHPELARGTVEFVAPAEYMVRAPMPPTYFFAIDVSAAAVSSGALATVAAAIKDSLDKLPGDGRTQARRGGAGCWGGLGWAGVGWDGLGWAGVVWAGGLRAATTAAPARQAGPAHRPPRPNPAPPPGRLFDV